MDEEGGRGFMALIFHLIQSFFFSFYIHTTSTEVKVQLRPKDTLLTASSKSSVLTCVCEQMVAPMCRRVAPIGLCNWVYSSHSSVETLKENKDIIKSRPNQNLLTLPIKKVLLSCSRGLIERDYGRKKKRQNICGVWGSKSSTD